MANFDSYYDDPSQQDWQDQVRQQVLSQMGSDPTVTAAPAPEASTPSPDFGSPSPAYAEPAPAAASGAPDTPAPGNDPNQIQGWYASYLGRPASDAEIQSHMGNPGGLGAVQNLIANSPEADAYNKAHQLGNYKPQAPAPAAAAATGGGGGGAAPVLPSSAGAFGLSNGYATPPSDTSWRDSIRKILLSRLAADQQPVDENAPNIQAALNASKDAYTRQNTTERDQLAERLYAQGSGLNTDAITQKVQQSNERTGTAQSTLRAQLLMSAYRDKQQELTHLLDLATQTGDTESAQQIQVTLANLQAALQREGLGVNLAEFGGQLNQNAALFGLNG